MRLFSPQFARPDRRPPQCIARVVRALAAFACRKPQMVRTRVSSPALALVTMPWKDPLGLVRKCSAGLGQADRYGGVFPPHRIPIMFRDLTVIPIRMGLRPAMTEGAVRRASALHDLMATVNLTKSR